jgi:hypothetical protein
MSAKVIKYVEEFNEGDLEFLETVFGDVQNILRFFKKNNVLHLVDPFSSGLEDYENQILYYLINDFKDEGTFKLAIDQFSDIIEKDGNYYLRLDDKYDLADLFDDSGRDFTSKDYVKSIFGEDNLEHFSDTTDNIYRDVIEELNPDNIELLKQHMLEVLTNLEIKVDDDCPVLFHNRMEDGIFYLTPENMGDVISDEESFMYLLDNDYLPNVTGDLHNIHYNAYNAAYETEIYNDIMSELETYFDTKTGTWGTEQSKYNPEKLYEIYTIKIYPNVFRETIINFLGNRNFWGYYNYNLGYLGTWLTMMTTMIAEDDLEALSFRVSDYPDHRLINRYINENIGDYF